MAVHIVVQNKEAMSREHPDAEVKVECKAQNTSQKGQAFASEQ